MFLLSGFLTKLLSTCPEDPLIHITTISTLGTTTLSIAGKITSCSRFSTAVTTLFTSNVILSAIKFQGPERDSDSHGQAFYGCDHSQGPFLKN